MLKDRPAPLTRRDMHARAQTLLQQNDIAGMRSLVAQVCPSSGYSTGPYGEDHRGELISAILSSDNMDMVRIFDEDVIKEWCDSNADIVIFKCPKLFAQWASSNIYVVTSIGRVLKTLPPDERQDVLEGRSNLVAGTFLHGVLTEDPTLWNYLTPAWIGPANSPLRQAASALGWQPSMLGAMVKDFLHRSSTGEWVENVKYAYSLYIAVHERNRLAEETRRQSQQRKGFLTGKPLNAAQQQVELQEDANPWDVELALALATCTNFKHVLVPHKGMPRISDKDRDHLASIAQMHVSLGCLETLTDALCHGELSGLPSDSMQALPLPESYSDLGH